MTLGMPWDYVVSEPVDLRGSLLVTALPSFGMVGPVAARFLVAHLGMRAIGTLDGDALPPTAIASKGIVTGPIQAFASELACGLDGRCDRLVVLKGDVPLPIEELSPLADAVAKWAAGSGVALLVGLEGYPVDPSGGVAAQPLAAANVPAAGFVDRLPAKPLDGMVTGFNAALLARANKYRLPAIGLFAPVEAERTDARAAASLLTLVDPLVPQIHLRPEEFLKRAEEAEVELRAERERGERASAKLAESVNRGYV